MSITLLCPNLKCRAVLVVPDEARGKKVLCSKCGTTLSVPDMAVGNAAQKKR